MAKHKSKKALREIHADMRLAHAQGSLGAVKQLLELHPEIEHTDVDGNYGVPTGVAGWLHNAAGYGHLDLVDFWLARGWDINCNIYKSKSDGLHTALHNAQNAAITRALVAKGANVNAWARYGGTPVHFAIVRGDPEQVKILLDAGADPSLADFEGRTPLALAIELKSVEGKDVNGLREGREAAAKILIDIGAPQTGRRPTGLPTRAPMIDLTKDATKIFAKLTAAIKQFTKEQSDPVTGLFLAVSGIEGYVMIAFDTTGADNPWDASMSEYSSLEFNRWRLAYELQDGGIKIKEFDGNTFNSDTALSDALFDKPFFCACVGVLKEAERAHIFEALTHTDTFTVGVDAASGEHAESWQPKFAGH